MKKSSTASREAQQKRYKKRVLEACQTWKPGLIARAKAKKNHKEK